MKFAHTIKVSVFAYSEEDENKIKEALLSLFPFDLEKEKISLTEETATGFEEKKIIIYSVVLNKEKHTNLFLKNLTKTFSEEQKSLLLRQKNRLDDELDFFIRLDKKKIVSENPEYWITDSGDCFHIKISVAAFPAKKEAAYKVIEKIFEDEGGKNE